MSLPRVTLLVLAGLLALCAGAYVVSGALARSASEAIGVPTDVRRVVLHTDAGDIDVRTVDGVGEVTVRRRARWLLDEPTLRRTVRSGTLHVSAACPPLAELGPCATDLEVLVPEDVDVTAVTDAGDVRAARLGGRVELLAQGDVLGRRLRPLVVRAVSRAGRLQLEFRNAPTQVEAVADRDVLIAVPGGDDYRIEDAGAGDVTVTGVFRSDLASRRIVVEAAGHARIEGR